MYNRRQFLQQSSVLAMSMLVKPNLLNNAKYAMGLQLYTVNEPMYANTPQTLHKIALMGFKEVETYVDYGDTNRFWKMPAKTLMQLLTDNGLTTYSGHYPMNNFIMPGSKGDDLKKYVDFCIESAIILNQQYIVWPWLQPELRGIDTFKVLAEHLNKIGEQMKQANLQLAYHNQGVEFEEQNGTNGFQIILNETESDLVKIELDTYWFAFSSTTPAHEYFEKHPKRFPLLHFKDMDKKDNRLHTVLGEGTIDLTTYTKDYSLAGVQHIMIEQGNNYVPDVFNCIERSANYMKKYLL
jgi:sugar phosphate isomerase/epimerase